MQDYRLLFQLCELFKLKEIFSKIRKKDEAQEEAEIKL